MTKTDRHRIVTTAALAAVGGSIFLGYTHTSSSKDGAYGLGSLFAGLVLLYLVSTWQADEKSLLYKRGLLVNPALLFVLWGAGMLCKVYKAPEVMLDVLVVGSLVALGGGTVAVVVGEWRRTRKDPTRAGQ
jgi:hypothetical protein